MPPEDCRRRSAARWAIPAVLAAGGALAIVVGDVAAKSRARAVGAETAPPAPPPAASRRRHCAGRRPVAPAPAPPASRSRCGGSPPGAILLDGAPAAAPLKLGRDDRRHLVVARAPGFYDRTIELEADRDQAVDLMLTAVSETEKPRATNQPAEHPARLARIAGGGARARPGAASPSPPRRQREEKVQLRRDVTRDGAP